MTRGIRNNNPGNIRHSPTVWQGQAEAQPDPDFVAFISMPYGIRAIAKILLTYQSVHGLKTIEAMIFRWAPPEENDTSAYIASVSSFLSVAPDAPFLLSEGTNLADLIRAIIRQENGVEASSVVTLAQIDSGVSLS